jgi:hypothetical protein
MKVDKIFGIRCHKLIISNIVLVLLLGLIAILISVGIVMAQGVATLREGEEKPFLQPYSREATNKILDASLKPSSNNNYKVKGIKRSSKVGVSTSKNIPAIYQRTQQASKVQPARPNITSAGKPLTIEAYNQYGSGVCGSFLDGYLLKSLNEKKSAGKKTLRDDTGDEGLLKEKRGSLIK